MIFLTGGMNDMAGKSKEKPQYTCTAHYTEGCGQRVTEALVDIYYNRLRGIGSPLPDIAESITSRGPGE